MNEIVFAIVLISAIGLITGLGLAIASLFFAVPKNEKAEAIRACLPGANCGACGFSGCDGYACALAENKTEKLSLCAPGGAAAAKEISKILGKEAGSVTPMAAAVLCQGDRASAEYKLHYSGIPSCKAAAQLFGGQKACVYGCLGFGDCLAACPYEAIFICNGVARVNPDKCRACKKCIAACPKGLITLLPLNTPQAAVLCKNRDKGANTRKQCKLGCIGCMRCVKACEHGAVTVENNLARVDYTKCTGCGKCHAVCPVKCIDVITLQQHKKETRK